jgi:serralysin
MSLSDFAWTEGPDIFEWSGVLSNYEPINTLGGDDAIFIIAASTYGGFFNSSALDMGEGDDILQITLTSSYNGSTGLSPANINLGGGNDKIIVGGRWDYGIYQYGDDTQTSLKEIDVIDLGDGSDQIVTEGEDGGAFRFLFGIILGKAGNDKITSKSVSNEGYPVEALYLNNSTIDLGADSDEIEAIYGNIFLADSAILMGGGSDIIRCEVEIYGYDSSIDLGEGNDLIIAESIRSDASFSINGGAGVDTVETSSSYSLGANLERLILTGSSATTGNGNSLNNALTGNTANNVLNGGAGADRLNGGGGNDSLIGGTGKDNLTGSTGVDKFIYKSITESRAGSAARDVITDFRGSSSEKINLSAIDAYSKTTGNQAFTFIGSSAFTGSKGEARFSGGILQINTGTDKTADMEIALTGVTIFRSNFLVL